MVVGRIGVFKLGTLTYSAFFGVFQHYQSACGCKIIRAFQYLYPTFLHIFEYFLAVEIFFFLGICFAHPFASILFKNMCDFQLITLGFITRSKTPFFPYKRVEYLWSTYMKRREKVPLFLHEMRPTFAFPPYIRSWYFTLVTNHIWTLRNV